MTLLKGLARPVPAGTPRRLFLVRRVPITKPTKTIEVSVQEGYSLWADVYDRGNALIELEEKRVEPILARLEAGYALDVGAGTGRYALKLARRGFRVTAIDPNPAMLDVARNSAAREELDVQFIQARLASGLPVDDCAYDLLICALVLCHVPGLDLGAREFSSVLRPGGLVLITDFHPDTIAQGIETQLDRDGVRYQLPNEKHGKQTYMSALEGAGFELVEVQDLLTREATKERFSDEYWARLSDTNFCLLILARKP